MATPTRFHVRCWPETIAGEHGWSFEIRDDDRRFRGSGWSRGRKQDALDDARQQINRLQNTTRRAS